MMTLYPKLILDALATVRYPGNGKNLVEAEMIADNMRIDGMSVSFSIVFEKSTDPFRKSIVKAADISVRKAPESFDTASASPFIAGSNCFKITFTLLIIFTIL